MQIMMPKLLLRTFLSLVCHDAFVCLFIPLPSPFFFLNQLLCFAVYGEGIRKRSAVTVKSTPPIVEVTVEANVPETEVTVRATEESSPDKDFSFLWSHIPDFSQKDLIQRLSTQTPTFFYSLADQPVFREHLLPIFMVPIVTLTNISIKQLREHDLERFSFALTILETTKVDVSFFRTKIELLNSLVARSKKTHLQEIDDAEVVLFHKKEYYESHRDALKIELDSLKKHVADLKCCISYLNVPLFEVTQKLDDLAARRSSLLEDVKNTLGCDFNDMVASTVGDFICQL